MIRNIEQLKYLFRIDDALFDKVNIKRKYLNFLPIYYSFEYISRSTYV